MSDGFDGFFLFGFSFQTLHLSHLNFEIHTCTFLHHIANERTEMNNIDERMSIWLERNRMDGMEYLWGHMIAPRNLDLHSLGSFTNIAGDQDLQTPTFLDWTRHIQYYGMGFYLAISKEICRKRIE
jgi:hypothetical protein